MKKYFFALAIIILASLAVYSNTFQSTFHLDDEASIMRNAAIRHIENIKAIWDFWPARFLTYFSVALNYKLGVLNVFSYHVFNILIHTMASLFAFWLALLTLSAPSLKDDKMNAPACIIALFAGLIFAVHPIQTQAVTYIIQRATSMAGLFYIATLCFYAKSRLSKSYSAFLYYSCAIITAIFAFFSKEVTLTLPFMILLYEFVFIGEGKRVSWRHVAPFLVLTLVIPAVSLLTNSYDIRNLKKPSEEPPYATPLQYLLTQFRVLVTYIRVLVVPVNQNVDYRYAIEKSFFKPLVYGNLALHLAILGAGIAIFKKKPLISFCIFWFFITLIPESSIFPIRDLLFEHRLYIPMFGYGLLISSAAYYLIGRKNIKLMTCLLIAIVAIYGALAFNRNFAWKDEMSLWSDVIKKNT